MWPPKSYAEITRVKAVGGVGSAKARGTADIDSAAVPTVSPELHPRSRYSSAMPFTCGECGAEAPDGSKFCPECGTRMVATCSGCGQANPPGHKFCAECGTSLGTSPTPLPPPVKEVSTEQRRTVTVLFADLAGFTSHTERSDPEDVRERLTTYHGRVRQDVERFGGRIEKLMGDGVFAVFGAPVAHEDDPERAVRAALRIQESVEDLNATDAALALSVRASVTTGEAIVQLEDTIDREGIIGDVVNTASRLEAVAAPGEVVVDERTYLACRSTLDFDPLDPVILKGKAEPVPIWRAKAARSRFGVAVEEEPSTPFVGRAEELSLLVDAFERAVARRSPQLVTVAGEPGVGKSRLIREFRRAVDDRSDLVWWRQGRCLPYGEGVTFWAIGEIVKAQAGILESEPPEAAASKLRQAVESLVDDAAEAEWVRMRLGPLAGTGGTENVPRTELFAAWLRFFEALAGRNPLVLVIEDLHWADDAVADFLEHLLDWAHDAPVLLVTTARPELFSSRPQWGGGKRDAATIALSPLDDDDTKALMAALSGRVVMPAEAQQALLAHAGGNPLYVTEYVALAGERGWFEQLGRGEPLPLPDSIQAIIAARLDLLDPHDAAVLQIASVVGKVFWTGALSFAGSPTDLPQSLRRLVQRELIRPVRRSSMQGQDEYTFAHVLIRDVAYGRLTRDERARLHEAAARWLEAVSGDRVADVAELVAHHLVTAHELRPTDDPERKRRTYRFLMQAAERAKTLDAARGFEFYRQAVAMSSSDAERGRALLEQGILEFESIDESDTLYRAAMDAFAAADDREGEAEALSALASNEWYRGNSTRADEYAERARRLVEGLPPSVAVAQVLNSVASQLQLRGREEEALDLVDHTLAIAQSIGDTAAYSKALVTRGSALTQIGEFSGIDQVEEALRIQLDRNDTPRAMSAYNNVATFYVHTGELGRAKTLIDQAIAYGKQRGLPAHVDWSEMTKCEALFPLGEWDDVIEITQRLIKTDAARGGSQVGAFAMSWEAMVRFHRGEGSEPRRLWTEFLASARETQDPQAMFPALAGGIWIEETAGDPSAALDLAAEFLGMAADHPVFLGGYLPASAPSMVRLGLAEELDGLHRAAIGGSPWLDAHLGAVAALFDEADGEYAAALDRYRQVWEVGDRLEQRFWTTVARLDGARCALMLGIDTEAEELLATAERTATAMGARRLLDDIAALRNEDEALRA